MTVTLAWSPLTPVGTAKCSLIRQSSTTDHAVIYFTMATAMGEPVSDTRSPSKGADVMAWLCVAATILLTVYGQLVVKWQVQRLGALPASLRGRAEFFVT